MKTPREILFERHWHAESELDAVRRKALAKLPAAGAADKADLDTAPALGEARPFPTLPKPCKPSPAFKRR